MTEINPNIEQYKKAGNIAAQARDHGIKLIKVGASLLEVTNQIEEKIFSLGGKLAFPTQISINEVAAHNCPTTDDTYVFKEEDMAKIDVGVHVDGFIGDTARTVYLGKDEKMISLKQASLNALNAALKMATPGTRINEIGAAIEKEITSLGFEPVKNLSGHGLGQFQIHVKPNIPNCDDESNIKLERGQVFAIEPFATTGGGMVGEGNDAEVFMLLNKKPVRNIFTRQILKEVDSFNGLPFCSRQLERNFNKLKVRIGLKEMDQMEMLHLYPPLIEKHKGIVSQAEDTVIIDDVPIITTRI
ncbi:type II methionyl aminopeptidase [Nanoarchaeota archaeon]